LLVFISKGTQTAAAALEEDTSNYLTFIYEP